MSDLSEKQLAVELVKAMLNHNSQIVKGTSGSEDNLSNIVSIAQSYAYALEVIQGKVDPLKDLPQK